MHLLTHQAAEFDLSRCCLQITTRPEDQPDAAAACERLRLEWVVQIQGTVIKRSDPNPDLPTGLVELVPSSVTVLNTAPAKLPLLPSDKTVPKEETRLRNRILDLRSAIQICTTWCMEIMICHWAACCNLHKHARFCELFCSARHCKTGDPASSIS